MYVLKHAAGVWHVRLYRCLIKTAFQKSAVDPIFYMRRRCGDEVYLLFYVDDVLVVAEEIAARFEVRVEHTVTKYLGLVCDIRKE